jgi:hypothetical protein
LSVEEFVQRFEEPQLPVVIRGLTEQWPAASTWTFPQLAQLYGKHRFKVGSDDDGYAVRLKLKYYLHYLEHHAPKVREQTPPPLESTSWLRQRDARPGARHLHTFRC